MLSWPALPRRFFGIGGGPRAGSRGTPAAAGRSSNSRRPCGAPRSEAPLAWNLDFPRNPGFAFRAAAFTPGGFTTPMDLAARAGLGLAPLPAGRLVLDLEARAGRFAFGRDFGRVFERDFARAFGRDLGLAFRRAEEARFFIFLGLRDLGLFPDRFPAMNDSSSGDEPFYFRWRHSNWSLLGVQDWNEVDVSRGRVSVLRTSVRKDRLVHRGGELDVLEAQHRRLSLESVERGEAHRAEPGPLFPG